MKSKCCIIIVGNVEFMGLLYSKTVTFTYVGTNAARQNSGMD